MMGDIFTCVAATTEGLDNFVIIVFLFYSSGDPHSALSASMYVCACVSNCHFTTGNYTTLLYLS